MEALVPNQVISDVARQYLALSMVPEVGPIRARNLVKHFGTIDAVLGTSMAQLQQVEQIGSKTARSIFDGRNNSEAVEREIVRAAECGVRILCPEDSAYPQPLIHIPDPPICLFVRGELQSTDGIAIAIVGTRRCSHYGQEQALRFGEQLGAAGFTVVSGLARGVDGCAHRGALRGGGRTIAVLGNGLPQIYPSEHESLAEEIAQAGAVISELPMCTPPDATNFPGRNRIIAGLSLGVLVIEAGKTSGALITARLALEYNREVFALPGRIDRPELTAGVNAMIRDGHAKLVTGMDDILDELAEVGQIMKRDAAVTPTSERAGHASERVSLCRLAEHEQAIVDAIRNGAEDADAICAVTPLDTGRVMSTLTTLELRGLVVRLPGNRFELKQR